MVDRTVHVVDDDPAVRRSLERLLDAAGFHVVSYQSPAAFLNAASGLSAGCVLLDIRMPGVDGLEVQSRLNRLRVNLPVIVMTGHGDVPSAVRAMKAGAVDFLEKPFEDETLLNAIGGGVRKGQPTHRGGSGGSTRRPAHSHAKSTGTGSFGCLAGGTPK